MTFNYRQENPALPKRIVIEVIPQTAQRYDTLGDWYYDEERVLYIKCSGDDHEAALLVGLHELIEAWLCADRGITQEVVDQFDLKWGEVGEPGDDPRAPYYVEHRKAMLIEHLMANFLSRRDYGRVE